MASDLIIRRTGPEVAWHSVSIKSATSRTQIEKMMSDGGSGVLGRFGKEKNIAPIVCPSSQRAAFISIAFGFFYSE